MILWKCCTQNPSKSGKLSSVHRTGKVFIRVPKKGNAKECSNYHIIALISHASKVILKILQARLQQYMTKNFQMFKLDLEKEEEPEIKLPTSLGSRKSKRVPGKHLFLLYWGFPCSSAGKESTCNVETWVRSKGCEDPLGSLPTPVFCPGEFHALYSPWGCKESDMTEQLSLSALLTIPKPLTVWITTVENS